MKKNLSTELILPAFWLFLFIVTPKTEIRDIKLRKADHTELKKPGLLEPGAANAIDKNKQATFTKAVYLSGY